MNFDQFVRKRNSLTPLQARSAGVPTVRADVPEETLLEIWDAFYENRRSIDALFLFYDNGIDLKRDQNRTNVSPRNDNSFICCRAFGQYVSMSRIRVLCRAMIRRVRQVWLLTLSNEKGKKKNYRSSAGVSNIPENVGRYIDFLIREYKHTYVSDGFHKRIPTLWIKNGDNFYFRKYDVIILFYRVERVSFLFLEFMFPKNIK